LGTSPACLKEMFRDDGFMRWALLLFVSYSVFAAEPPKEILNLWRTLPKVAATTPQKAYRDLHTWLPDRGLRGLYAKAQFALNIAQLQKVSGHRIFHSGPHQAGKLNLKALDDFGHYNPAFIKWFTAHGVPGKNDAKLKAELQPVYDKFLRRTARGFFAAHKSVMTDPERLKKVQSQYLERIDNEKAAGIFLQEAFRSAADQLEKAGHDWYEASVAHGFWVRRSIDGTNDECHALLLALLKTHDAKWLKANLR